MLNNGSNRGHSYLISDIKGNIFKASPSRQIFVITLYVIVATLYKVSKE